MAKRRKGKSRRRGGYHRKKRHGGHKSKKIPIAATLGGFAGLYNLVFMNNAAGSNIAHATNILLHAPTAANAQNAVRIAKATDVIAVATPVVLGIAVSGAGKFLGANKYVHKIPVIGKKVNI